MPIYEYQCGSCAHQFEELMRHSDPDPVCPSCGHEGVNKLMSNTSFQLKGTGWYVTDYKGGGKDKPKADGASSEGSASSSSSTAGTDKSSDSSSSTSSTAP